jgi:hypothetical protein
MATYPGLFVVSTDNLWIWAAIGFLGGLVLFYRGFRMLQRKRLILNTPTSKIRSASLGLVEVNGLAAGPYTIPAPITARPCYYYRTRAWECHRSGKREEWRLAADESLHVPFYLDDNTGRVLVDPNGADMDIHRDFQEEYGGSLFFGKEMPPNVRAFLTRYGVSGDRRVKVEERSIKPKNALFIVGTLAENTEEGVTPTAVPTSFQSDATFKVNLPSGIAGKMEAALEHLPGTTVTRTMTVTTKYGSGPVHQEVIHLSPNTPARNSSDMTQQGKIAAALVKAGITNPAAWEAAGVANSQAALTLAAGGVGAPGFDPAPNVTTSLTEGYDLQPKVVLRKGENNTTFLISWRSEREVVQAMAWKSTACIWGGPLLMLLSLYVLLEHFGML